MIQTVSFAISNHSIAPYGTWENLRERIYALGLNGIEAINDPFDSVPDFPQDLVSGYHMAFYMDWVDFWRGDEDKLLRKFGTWEEIRKIYPGRKPEDLLRYFQEDLAAGQRLNTPYMVFHVSDVSLEEGYTYQWLHTDMEVLDASVEFINRLLRNVEPTFDFLIENQWWPGFKFTDPHLTEYILSRIDYPRVGIMLDTGHLMNANTRLCTQVDGIAWILKNIMGHGELSKRIYGLHFHQSLSGHYVRSHVGVIPAEFLGDYFEKFGINYSHVLQIDQHLPWTDPNCVQIIDAVQPKYLTHELSYGPNRPLFAAVKQQLHMIQEGYHR